MGLGAPLFNTGTIRGDIVPERHRCRWSLPLLHFVLCFVLRFVLVNGRLRKHNNRLGHLLAGADKSRCQVALCAQSARPCDWPGAWAAAVHASSVAMLVFGGDDGRAEHNSVRLRHFRQYLPCNQLSARTAYKATWNDRTARRVELQGAREWCVSTLSVSSSRSFSFNSALR